MIRSLNEAGLQEMQISIDGVRPNATTEKVLDRLRQRLDWLRDEAKFNVTVSGVIGACPPEEAEEVVRYAAGMGFTPRLGVMTDVNGQVRLSAEELVMYRRITRQLPRTWMDLTNFSDGLVTTGKSPFRCRSGSRYLYVDEDGRVAWCSQTRELWGKALADYTRDDLREQFYTPKPCQDSCAIGCVRQASQVDEWRSQSKPAGQ
jgi:MoaA/NifB/PqqE/SkfB family radical SAM enzyme